MANDSKSIQRKISVGIPSWVPTWIGPGGNVTLHLAEGGCRGLREEDGKEVVGSDHGHNRVSTYAGITIAIVYPRE